MTSALTLAPRTQNKLLQLLLLVALLPTALAKGDFDSQQFLRRKRLAQTESINGKRSDASSSVWDGGALADLWQHAWDASDFQHTSERYLAAEVQASMSMSISLAPSKMSIRDPTFAPVNEPSGTVDPTTLPTVVFSSAPFTISPVQPATIIPASTPSQLCLEGKTRAEFVLEKLESFSGEQVLLDGSTAQGMAFRFLVDDPLLSICVPQTVEQRYALATLFFSTEGSTWTRRDKWLEESHECQWFGVTCEENQGTLFVKTLELAFNNLDGRLPEEMSALFMVEKLDFFANALTGALPNSVEKLTRLAFIDFQENLLTGSALPSSLFGLGGLRGYRVNGNALTGSIPTQVVALQNLEQLWVADNDIAGPLPSELGSLRNLKSLFLFDNSMLGSLPSEIGLLPLEDIRLYGNFFQGSIPTQLFNVGSLRSMRLDGNFFLGEIPPVLGQLTNLIDLRVNSNNLSGEIPSEIGLLTNLEYLLLNENFWRSTIPDVFTNYQRLDFFDISNTMVFGTIPETLFAVSTLRIAYMSNCSLSGTIPATFADPPLLRDLFLDGNRITGEVPPVAGGKLRFLNEFLIQRTQLSGTIPQSVCDLRRFHVLDDLWADCGGGDPEIFCDFPECCNRCFEGSASRRRIRRS